MEIVIAEAGRWDPAWVQAWGSIAAILAGFGVVLLQAHLQRRSALADQRELRRYVAALAAQIYARMNTTLDTFRLAAEAGQAVSMNFDTDPMDMTCAELMSLEVSQLGHPTFVLLTRKVALHAKAFSELAGQSEGMQISATRLQQMRTLRNGLAPTIAALAGLAVDIRFGDKKARSH